MVLTQGERMVWAVAFVKSAYKSGVPVADAMVMQAAVADACGMVRLMRMPPFTVGNTYRLEDEDVAMLRAMLEDVP